MRIEESRHAVQRMWERFNLRVNIPERKIIREAEQREINETFHVGAGRFVFVLARVSRDVVRIVTVYCRRKRNKDTREERADYVRTRKQVWKRGRRKWVNWWEPKNRE